MAIQMTTQTMVLIILAVIFLAIGIVAVLSASGLSVPIFDQIWKMINDLKLPGLG